MLKKILSLLCTMMILLSLSACNNPDEPVIDTPPVDTNNTENVELENNLMIVNTDSYTLTFDILGSWAEYAGNAEIREIAQAVLSSTAESNTNNSTFFYVLIDKYDAANQTLKDKVVEGIKEQYESVEFESINETNTNSEHKIISVYNVTENGDSIKKYQYTIVRDGYEISFIYSAPTLIYNSQKGYINDMIDSAEFAVTNIAK